MGNLPLGYFSLDLTRIEVLVAILTFFATTFMAALVYFRNTHSWTNIFFVLLAIVFDAYIVTNFFSLHPNNIETQFMWIKIVMFVSSFMAPLLFLLVHTFPRDDIRLNKLSIFLIVIISFVTGVAALKGYVFTSLDISGGVPLPVPGPAMPLFLINFVGIILLSFFVLIRKYSRAEGTERGQLRYLLWGIVVSFSLLAVVTVISVVIFETSQLVFLGPVFFVVLLGAIAFAIVKYQLFNVKILAVNLLVISIWLILGSKLFVFKSLGEFFVDSMVFVLMILFGILLIRNVKKEIEQRIKLETISGQLKEANEKLKELDHLKSEFLSFASHQMKAPLAAIKGFATLICDGTYGEVSEKVKDAADKIRQSADRMIRLVGDSLNIRKIEEGKMDYKFEKIDVVKMVNDIFEELKPLAQKKNLDFSFEAHAAVGWINADAQSIRQVFQNLIENSIKYTDSGFVKIATESYAGYFNFSVTDSGHGISQELIPHLFEEFKRQAEVKQIEGTGLGLYIAHEITTAHKGEIIVESDGPGKGSKFIVKIPLV